MCRSEVVPRTRKTKKSCGVPVGAFLLTRIREEDVSLDMPVVMRRLAPIGQTVLKARRLAATMASGEHVERSDVFPAMIFKVFASPERENTPYKLVSLSRLPSNFQHESTSKIQ